MFKKLVMMVMVSVVFEVMAEQEYYACVLPEPIRESSMFVFMYDEVQKGLLDGDSGILGMWPYGKGAHKCGVTPFYDLTQKDAVRSNLGVKTSALQFTCQRMTLSDEGASLSTITFVFDRESKTLWNAVYSDAHYNEKVADKYIANSTPESRRFICDKLDPSQFKKP